MTILAFDLARRYGWAVVDSNGAYVASGCRELAALVLDGEQYHRLALSIADLVDQYAPEWIAVEKPIHTGRTTSIQTARALYCYAGIAAMTAYLREIGYVELARSSCCKQILGSGLATKADGVAFARQYKPGLASEDEADAILVALTAHKSRFMPPPARPRDWKPCAH